MPSGALIAVTIQGADEGDTATIAETLAEAEAQLDAVIERAPEGVNPDAPAEVVADKGYHSDATLLEIETGGLRSYISEPDRGRR
jgi:transposase